MDLLAVTMLSSGLGDAVTLKHLALAEYTIAHSVTQKLWYIRMVSLVGTVHFAPLGVERMYINLDFEAL